MGQPKPIRAEQSSGLLSGRMAPVSQPVTGGVVVPFPVARRGVLDPVASYRRFPELWRAFLHAHFRTPGEVARAFAVSEKAAAKWWAGIGGPSGDKVAYACRTIEGAAQFLLVAE